MTVWPVFCEASLDMHSCLSEAGRCMWADGAMLPVCTGVAVQADGVLVVAVLVGHAAALRAAPL